MIWGMTLHPGEEFTRKVFGEEHLTLASLECRMSKYETKSRPNACLILKANMREHVICTLEKGVINQQCLDLVFDQGEKITFMAEGTGIIYLTGYTIKQQDEQNERQEDQTGDIFIRDEENNDVNNEKLPENQENDNQGSSNQGNGNQGNSNQGSRSQSSKHGEILIKVENDSGDGMENNEPCREEMDDEPSTAGEPMSADGSDRKDSDNDDTLQGKGTDGKDDGDSGGINCSHVQCSFGGYEDNIVSSDNIGCSGDDKGYINSGDDSDLHGDGIQGDGNSSDYVDNSEVHLSVSGVPCDEDSMYDSDENDVVDEVIKEDEDLNDGDRDVDSCKDEKGSSKHQKGEVEIVGRFGPEKQEGFINVMSEGNEESVTGISKVSLEKENLDKSSRLKKSRRNVRSFAEPVKESKGGSKKHRYFRSKNTLETLSEQKLHLTRGVKTVVDSERKCRRNKFGKELSRCEHNCKGLDYKCTKKECRILLPRCEKLPLK